MTTRLMAVGYQPNWWEILTSPFMRNALLLGVALLGVLPGILLAIALVAGGVFLAPKRLDAAGKAASQARFASRTGSAAFSAAKVDADDSIPSRTKRAQSFMGFKTSS